MGQRYTNMEPKRVRKRQRNRKATKAGRVRRERERVSEICNTDKYRSRDSKG